MIQIKIVYIIIFVLGISLVTNGSIGFSFSQASQLNSYGSSDYLNTKVQTNSLNLSKPIYQATNSHFWQLIIYLPIHFQLLKNLSMIME
jgi:hypothetical protein